MLHWRSFQFAFQWAGALRDVVVAGTNLADWERLVAALPGWGYRTSWRQDGRDVALPENVAAIFGRAASYEPLRLEVGALHVNLWFASIDEMEFDLDPAEVFRERQFAAVCEFLERVGTLLQRRVVLQWEGGGPEVLAFAPGTGFTSGDPRAWHPPRAQRFRGLAIVVLPMSVVVFCLALARVPSRMLLSWLGSGPPRLGDSAPPYIAWDVVTMLAMAGLCVGSLLWLARPCMLRWGAARLERD